MGETGRTLKKRIEHKTAAKKEDKRNRVAVHVKTTKLNWERTRVISNETEYWEAINIRTNQTTNLDCGLKLNDTCYSVLGVPPSNPISFLSL